MRDEIDVVTVDLRLERPGEQVLQRALLERSGGGGLHEEDAQEACGSNAG